MVQQKKKVYPAPKFKSLEEEDEFWRTHSPLVEGYEVTMSRPAKTEKRRSFLAVRLSGQEIHQLREAADRQGVNLSTLVRSVLLRAMKEEKTRAKPVTTDDLEKVFRKVIKVVQTKSSPEKNPEKKRRVAAVR